LLVTVVPGCFLAGWWQVNRALSGNLLSYFYSVEWPIFALLGVLAWWQLIHDEPVPGDYARTKRDKRTFLHRDDEVPTKPLVWDQALESPELVAYNHYLRALAEGRGRKTWGNPRGLPVMDADLLDDQTGLLDAESGLLDAESGLLDDQTGTGVTTAGGATAN
jgi:hypothetical protein